MIDRESAEEIDKCAARWVVRSDKGPLDVAAQRELDAWLAGDSRRRGAFVRAKTAWLMLDRAQVLATPEGRAAPRPAALKLPRLSRRQLMVGGSAAAGVALFAPVVVDQALRTRYDTELGEIRRVPLRDGSLAAINTQTDLAVEMQPTSRCVKLSKGEAWFQVAKDAKRPFVVESGPIRARAVGTAFSVRKQAAGSEVLVTEGVVEVWSQHAEDARLFLTAGQRTFVSNGSGAHEPTEAALEIDRALAWRDGQIILDGESLAQAAAEFNRYNVRKVVIADSGLAEQGLIGWFRTNDPEGFALAAAASLGGTVSMSDTAIIIELSDKKFVWKSDGNETALHP